MKPNLLALAISTAFAAASAGAQTNPSGGVAIHGSATFDTSKPNQLLITTRNGAGGNHSAIDWQSFSIALGSLTRIEQPNAASTSINRVVSNTPSQLLGTLSSNGQVVLVNQSGIAVGAGALVDTAGFTASVLGLSPADAAAARLRFEGAGPGALKVQGRIVARGGDVVLIAPSIELARTALVEAPSGNVILAAGQRVEITGRGLEGIALELQAPSDQAINLGTLKGDAVGIFASQLEHSGLIQANQLRLEGGRVLLKAGAEVLIDASGTQGGAGKVRMSGDSVDLQSSIQAANSTLQLNAGSGGITQGSNPIAADKLEIKSVGAVHLEAANNVGTLAAQAAAGDLSFNTNSNLTLTQATSPGVVSIQTSGGIRIPASALVTAGASGDALIVGAASGTFNLDSAAQFSAPNGRYLLYLNDPAAAHQYGNLSLAASDFKQYAASWSSAPAQANGNGWLFSVSPVVSANLTGQTSKTYDNTSAITLSANNFESVNGYLMGDIASVATTASGTLANVNAGSGIAVSANAAALAGIKDASNTYPVYGYQVNATGLIGQVTPAVVTASAASAVSLSGTRAYDGTNLVKAGIFTLGGLVAGQTLTLSGVGSVPDKNVGVDKPVTLGSLALGNGSGLASNYTLAGGVHRASITPAAITALSGINAASKVYDGSTNAVLDFDAVVFSGQLPGDRLSLASASAAFSDKNVGNFKTLNISSMTFVGPDAANYSYTGPNTVVTNAAITPAPITVSAVLAADNKVYDSSNRATVRALQSTLTGKIATDDVNLGALTGAFSDKNVGIGKTVTASGLTLTGADAANYSVQSGPALTTTANISQLTLTGLSGLNANNKVYDGGTSASINLGNAVFKGLLAGDQLAVTSATGQFADKNANVGKPVAISDIRIGGVDASNYAWGHLTNAISSARITPKTLTAVNGITAINKTYDHNSSATLRLDAVELDGKLPGDQLLLASASGNFSDRNPGFNKRVTINNFELTGLDAANYTFPGISTTRADIVVEQHTLGFMTGFFEQFNQAYKPSSGRSIDLQPQTGRKRQTPADNLVIEESLN